MMRLRISGPNFDDLARKIEVIAHPDLAPLAMELGEIMVAGNRAGLLAGTDSFGDQMTDLEESTIRRGRGGDGPPLVPRGAGSRAISDFQYRIEPGFDRTLVIGEWPNTPFIHFHATGTKYMVARDPVGIRPDDVALMAEAVETFATNLVQGA
jgi:hypothetical protein